MALFAKKTPAASYESSGGRLVSTDGKTLPLLGAHLRAEARGGLARVTLEQTFHNPHPQPLHVTYQLPLPSDAAVSGYAFRLGEERIVGEVDRKAAARERFEQAILDGKTAGLVDQERSSLFTQELGNVPPGAVVVAELTLDQKLAWLPEGAWEWHFPTVVAPRYLGAEGSVADAERITVEVADGKLRAGVSLELSVLDVIAAGQRPESPSHPMRAAPGLEGWTVSLADETARLDRDVVVRWMAVTAEPGLTLSVARPKPQAAHATSGYGLLTLTPPSPLGQPTALPRDLIVLLDTSGSMSGEPLDQARRIVSALIHTLTDQDRLEMIEFSSSPRRWKGKPVDGSARHRKDALSWLAGLRASGGTEMRTGILEALAPLRDEAQRQVILITDGLIGGESEVLSAILQKLPRASRVHTVGIGSAVNRSLTQPAARAGRGVELLVGLGEDVERAAGRLVARTCAPLITELSVTGSAVEAFAPQRIPDVFAGAPALIPLRLRAEGGELLVRGRTATGEYRQRLEVQPIRPATGSRAVCSLFAREAVEDLELSLAGGEAHRIVDPQIEQLGLSFQISTRLTSWVAVSPQQTVDPTSPTRHQQMPQELPHGMSVEGLGLRRPAHAIAPPPPPGMVFAMASAGAPPSAPAPRAAPEKKRKGGPELSRLKEVSRPSRAAVKDEQDRGAQNRFESEEAPEADQAEAFEGGEEAKLVRAEPVASTLRGRILRRADGELIVEVEIPAAMTWPQATVLRLELDDGSVLEVTVDATRSTRSGPLEAGMLARVALTFPAGSLGTRDPRQLTLGSWVIRL